MFILLLAGNIMYRQNKYSFIRTQKNIEHLYDLFSSVKRTHALQNYLIFRSPEDRTNRSPSRVARRCGRPRKAQYIAERTDFSLYSDQPDPVLPASSPFTQKSLTAPDLLPPAADCRSALTSREAFFRSLEYLRSNISHFTSDFVYITVDVSEFFHFNNLSPRAFLRSVQRELTDHLNRSINFIGTTYPRHFSEKYVFLACVPRKLILDEWLNGLSLISVSVNTMYITITPNITLHSADSDPNDLMIPPYRYDTDKEISSPPAIAASSAFYNLQMLPFYDIDVEYHPYFSPLNGKSCLARVVPCILLPNNKQAYDICSVLDPLSAGEPLFQFFSLLEKRICSKLSQNNNKSSFSRVLLSFPPALFCDSFYDRLIELTNHLSNLCSNLLIPPSSILLGVDSSILQRAADSSSIAEVLKHFSERRFSVAAENFTPSFACPLLDRFCVTAVDMDTNTLKECRDPQNFVRSLQAMGITFLLTGSMPGCLTDKKDILSSLLVRLHNTKQY